MVYKIEIKVETRFSPAVKALAKLVALASDCTLRITSLTLFNRMHQNVG